MAKTTTEEIEHAAWNNEDISMKTLEFIDMVYYVGVQSIYMLYRAGLIAKDAAMQRKKMLQNYYDRFDLDREIYRRHRVIEDALGGYRKELNTCGCEHCKKLLRLIDGRERPKESSEPAQN